MSRAAIPLLVSAALLVGCQGFAPADPATVAALRPMPLAAIVPGRCELELHSPGLSGTFDAVIARDGDAVRLQLFPDVGGKVLDLRVDASGIVVDFAGQPYEARAPLASAPPHLALALAALVGELASPVAAERVAGQRPRDGATEVQLQGGLVGLPVVARLGADGAITAYAWRVRGFAFGLTADGRFAGPGFDGWLRR